MRKEALQYMYTGEEMQRELMVAADEEGKMGRNVVTSMMKDQ